MEFLESLQSKYQKYHKKNNIIEHRKTRLEDERLMRIRLRTRNMDEHRPLENVVTPAKVTQNKTVTPQKINPKIDRRTRLNLWKQEREKKRELQKKQIKPVFKLGSATNLGFPNLNSDKTSFAPNKHIFKPPKNIKPITLQEIKNPKIQRVTRSQKPIASPPLELPRPRRKKRGTTQMKENIVNDDENVKSSGKRRRSLRKSVLKSGSEENKKEPVDEEKENKPLRTPENSAVYVSPYVTTARGKGSLRKENLNRSLLGLPSLSDHVSSPSGVAYFTNVLNNEVDHLQVLCRVWNEYKDCNDLSDDAKDLIDVAVGQATLLINKKFKQFEGLIRACKTGVGAEKEVTCADLQGFWDMIYMQVDNLNTRFNRLTTLKNNNWEEIEQLSVTTKVVKKRAPPKTTKLTASSGIRAAIIAARKKKQELAPPTVEDSVEFNGGFFVIKTPQKNTPSKCTPKPTPKSILKSNKKKSMVHKAVLFKDEESGNESVLNTTFEKSEKTPRRNKS